MQARGAALRSPNSVLVIIGNSEISTQTSTRLRKSKPHQKPISGTIARIGTVWSTTAHGNSERSIQRACDIATAIAMPSTEAIDEPDEGDLGRLVARLQDLVARRVVEDAVADDVVQRRQQEAALGVEDDVRREVPDADR